MIDWDNLPVTPPDKQETDYVDPTDFVLFMVHGYNGVLFVQLLDVPGQPEDALCDAWVTFAVDQPKQALLYWQKPRGDEGCLYLTVNKIVNDVVYATCIHGRITLQQPWRYKAEYEASKEWISHDSDDAQP